MDRIEKIHKLEAILSAATQPSQPSSPDILQQQDPPSGSGGCCNCQCHSQSTGSPLTSPPQSLSTPGSGGSSAISTPRTDVQCQTLSTGDIVITKVFFPDSGDNIKESK